MTRNRTGGWNRRRIAQIGGAALALGGGYWALRQPAGKAGGGPVAPAGMLRRGNMAEPDTLDPQQALAVYEDNIISDLMTGLMTHDVHGEPVPGMAQSWHTSDDGLVWTFKLRPAVWSDGHPFTAHDFVYSWRRMLDPATAARYAYFLYVLKNAETINSGKLPITALGVRAPDDNTLELTLEHPAAYLLEMLPHMTMYPVPAHVIARHGKRWSQPGNYVGNGPFLLVDWVPNDRVTVVKNPRFYDADSVKLDKVVFYPAADYSAALRRFRAGELDMVDRFPTDQINWLRQNLPQTLHPIAQLFVEFIQVNQSKPPFDDIRVRAAINLALNREVLTTKIRQLDEPPAYNVVAPGTANYPFGAALPYRHMPPAARVAKAQGLMRAAGFGPDKPLRVTHLIRSATPGAQKAMAAAIQQMLSLAYIDIAILPTDAAIFYKLLEQHDFEMAQAGWSADYNDAASFLEIFQTGNGNNWGGFSNPAFDALMNQARADSDFTSRGKILAAAETVLLKNQGVMPLFFWVSSELTWPYVKGWKANPLAIHPSRWISIDQAARKALFA